MADNNLFLLHEEWRAVPKDEVEISLHYVHRIIEDFYDDRPGVESILVEAGRIKPAPEAVGDAEEAEP